MARWCFCAVLLLTAAVQSLALHAREFSRVRDVRQRRSVTVDAEPDRPVWPDSFKVSFRFSVPYVSSKLGWQKAPLVTNLTFWRDDANGLQKLTRNDEIWYENIDKNFRYYVSPEYDHYNCVGEKINSTHGPTRRRLAAVNDGLLSSSLVTSSLRDVEDLGGLSPLLPDIREERWSYNSTYTDAAANTVHVWHYHVEHDDGYGQVDIDWYMHVTDKGVPLKLLQYGINYLTLGHWDEYFAEYFDFVAGPIDAKEFKPPKICKHVHLDGTENQLARQMRALVSHVVPNHHHGDHEYDGFAHRYGRFHASHDEYHERAAHYHRNKVFVEEHNARDDVTHTVAMNHFGDWSKEEFSALLRSTKRVIDDARHAVLPQLHVAKHPKHMLPRVLDWRGTLADSPVKDQAMCGSCWAFATIAPMETAFYRAMGRQQLLSEQYLMDCTWKWGNQGCLGGFQEKAYNAIIDGVGGVAAEDYPYLATNGWCKKDVDVVAQYKAVYNVTHYDKDALKEALLTKGPMTISFNGDFESFAFYKSGVYFNPNCSTALKDLDHALMISGWGTDEHGTDYWIIKNMWSTFWGEKGYARVDMHRNDCGVTALAQYVELDKHATERLIEKRDAKRQHQQEQ